MLLENIFADFKRTNLSLNSTASGSFLTIQGIFSLICLGNPYFLSITFALSRQWRDNLEREGAEMEGALFEVVHFQNGTLLLFSALPQSLQLSNFTLATLRT